MSTPEQFSLLPEPPFFPLMPTAGTYADLALHDLLARDLTQIDWLNDGKGWRLAAAVKELDYLGWEPQSIRVHAPSRRRPIALYSLPLKAKQFVASMRQGGGHASE
jgi:hypothetical protein